jgi:translation initiation factor IF-3
LTTPTAEYRVNYDIRVPEVRLIGPTGQNYGVVSIREAMTIARDANMDLVEVSPTAAPPVCRVLDYGKFLYERAKKEKEARRAQKQIEIKEIQLRPKIAQHDREYRIKDAREWLADGMKVRVRMKFRGREIQYPELALRDMQEVAKELADIGYVEIEPNMEGKTMLMIIAPGSNNKK